MPTRTINLKLQIPKTEEGRKVRSALWATHDQVNKAVAEIEKLLLLCRGEGYYTVNDQREEIEIKAETVRADALKMARAVQRKNGKENAGSDEEVRNILRCSYEKLVPSVNKGSDGDAQASNAWVSPMMDTTSEGGLSVYNKIIDPIPEWVDMMRKETAGWHETANDWLESEDAKRLMSAAGSPAGWVRNLRNGERWEDAFVKDQEKKKKELVTGNAPVIRELKKLGLFPLMKPPINSKFKGSSGVSKWDRAAVRLAVAHLLSWESWNHQTLAEHEKCKELKDKLSREYSGFNEQRKRFQIYENNRHEALKKIAFADDDNPFKIGGRMIRSWPKIREKWQKKGNTFTARKNILVDLQTTLKGRFGDPDFFLWLAADGREHLWKDQDCVTPHVKLNIADRALQRRRPYSLMTFADSRLHPRWAMYEAPGGSNLRNYKLLEDGRVKLSLLNYSETGALEEKEFNIKLAPSGQLQQLKIDATGEKTKIAYQSAYQDFEGIPGGSEILFDRPTMENRSSAMLAEGVHCPVWFKLTVDVVSKAPREWLNGRGQVQASPTINHFKTGLAKKSKHTNNLEAGLRVLSVDLGLRTFASCSVFELVDAKPKKGLYFKTDQPKLWAKHERSFKLTLPGEEVSDQKSVKEARKAARDEVYSIRRDMRRLKQLLRLSIIENKDEREEKLEKEISSLNENSDTALVVGLTFFERLNPDKSTWKFDCEQAHKKAEKALGKRIREWRSRTRKRPENWQEWRQTRAYHGGKSYWMIEYLEEVRKILTGWSLHGREAGQVNRQNREYGSIASNLLKHINKLKEDRTKAGTDLIIQAARGYVPVPGKHAKGWMEKYKPCRVILFEDLARYRFKVDRPRRENSQLMKWGHREIISESTLQAEIYGMLVETTGAGFSSRFHAKTGAAGVRCRYLKADDFENGTPKEYVANQMKNLIKTERLKPDMLVPWDGGELFATVSSERKPIIIHADINAAQNLQRRFWTRFGDAYRLSANKDGDGKWIVQASGSRVPGALELLVNGKANHIPQMGFILAGDPENGAVLKSEGETLNTKDNEELLAEDPIMNEIDEIEEDGQNSARETFFRDPSCKENKWYGSKKFWGTVKRNVRDVLLNSQQENPLQEEETADDIPF